VVIAGPKTSKRDFADGGSHARRGAVELFFARRVDQQSARQAQGQYGTQVRIQLPFWGGVFSLLPGAPVSSFGFRVIARERRRTTGRLLVSPRQPILSERHRLVLERRQVNRSADGVTVNEEERCTVHTEAVGLDLVFEAVCVEISVESRHVQLQLCGFGDQVCARRSNSSNSGGFRTRVRSRSRSRWGGHQMCYSPAFDGYWPFILL
jgi:hypothetical protein